ncbi:hypothetical protein G6F62_015063 [Rhizopus arrhizus]|nr:hypothetical protein G6F62_015063 [Rhizopus arrhizus]
MPATALTPTPNRYGRNGRRSHRPATTVTRSPRRWPPTRPTPSACTTCTATPGNGWRTGTARTTTRTRPRMIRKAPTAAMCACAGAARGTPGRSIPGRPTATGTPRKRATRWWACELGRARV